MLSGRRPSTTSTISSISVCPSLRMVLLGEEGVGKTAVLRRLATCGSPTRQGQDNGRGFSRNEGPLIDVSHVVRFKLSWRRNDENELDPSTADLYVFDPYGPHEVDALIKYDYLRDSHVAVAVYDVTNTDSFKEIPDWLSRLRQHRPADDKPLVILLGNKADCKRRRAVSKEDGERVRKALGVDLFTEISAKRSRKDEFEELIRQVRQCLADGRLAACMSADSPGRSTPGRRYSVLRRSSSINLPLSTACANACAEPTSLAWKAKHGESDSRLHDHELTRSKTCLPISSAICMSSETRPFRSRPRLRATLSAQLQKPIEEGGSSRCDSEERDERSQPPLSSISAKRSSLFRRWWDVLHRGFATKDGNGGSRSQEN